ncbi:MAG: hypothetical protein HWD84_10020 [Flavobacteriaceae bacterium]|nr:hypothetical protein [Flavobacteriaceae bacterium]
MRELVTPIGKYLFFTILVGCVCLASLKVFYATVASVQYYGITNAIDGWRNGSEVTEANYSEAKALAKSLVSNHSDMAFYKDTLAEVLQWGLYLGFEESKGVNQGLLKLYNESRAERPAWPVTWGNQAYVKWTAAAAEAEITYDLHQAIALGASTPELHILMTRFGFLFLKSNPKMYLEFNKAITHRFALGLRNNLSKAELIRIVENNNGAATACVWLRQTDPTPSLHQIFKCNK